MLHRTLDTLNKEWILNGLSEIQEMKPNLEVYIIIYQKQKFRALGLFSKGKSLKKKKERERGRKKETGNGDAHTLRGGIPGPKPISCPAR